MLKSLKLLCLLALSFNVQASDFTPDHLENIYGGSSRSEMEPEYCQLVGFRNENNGDVSFKLKVTYDGEELANFEKSSQEMSKQLEMHSEFIVLENSKQYVLININGTSIKNYYFHQKDSKGVLKRSYVCSGR